MPNKDVGRLQPLIGGGEMGQHVRDTDWSASPMGPYETWPQSLRSALSLVLNTKGIAALYWGPQQWLLYNDAYGVALGDRHPSAFGRPMPEVLTDIAPVLSPQVAEVLTTGRGFAIENLPMMMRRHGRVEETIWTYSFSPVQGEGEGFAGVLLIATEMTQQKAAEQELRTTEARQRHLLQQMPGFVGVLTGPDHVYEYVNDAYVAISGPRRFIGRTVREVFPEIAGQGFYELLDQAYATGEPFAAQAMPIRLAGEDDDRYIDLLYQPIRNDQGLVTGIFVGGYDTTARVRGRLYSDALVRLTDRISDLGDPDVIALAASSILGEMLKVSRVGYGTIDPEAETLHVRQDWSAAGVETLAGVVPLRAYGAFIDSLKRGEFISIDDVAQDARTASAADALRGRSAASFVNVLVIEQGRLVAVLYVNHGSVRSWQAEELAFIKEVAARTRIAVERSRSEAAMRDFNAILQERVATALREQAATEEALRQSQKMEAVGQLTGGLAHDFNNLLTGVTGSLELIQVRIAQGRIRDLDRYVNAAMSAANRAAALTHRLLAFSRRQTLDPKPTDVNRLVVGMEDLIRRTVGPGITLEPPVGAVGLWPTLVDPSQLENALLNLCINARDAMPDGGKLSIETANRWLDERTARDRDLAPGQYVSLCVSDTGTGMPPNVVAKAFDPFFTTKPIGMGTGLGLSMIYGFAKQSGGQVRIYSELGTGTMVCIYLPRHLGQVETAAPIPDLADAPRAEAGQTVLVVDDEPTVRMLVSEVLEDLGYTAIEAADGAGGLRVLQSDARIDLLVTDVGLPGGMNGRQVADAARVARPNLKVLFITGYAENAVLSHGHLDPGMHVLTKPFAMEALASRIKDLIAD
ncbi:ATP-binding protein [Roseomonas sp. 18066]|uniref:ATP-binding protein n=1 Tax=Roseomonas sp. 18066 TaxID=2681412 RepID=UPI001358B0B5|nr:ATP-binding protein [Roseomonas sp. 18066]